MLCQKTTTATTRFVSVLVSASHCRSWSMVRNYAALSYNPQPVAPPKELKSNLVGCDKDSSTTSNAIPTATRINHVQPDIDTAPKHPSEPSTANFELVNAGPGAIMLAHLPPHTSVRLSPGIVVGHSPNLTFHRPLYGGLSSAIMGRVMGDPLFMDEYRTNGSSGDLLLAPPRLGDLALLSLDGHVELVARRGAIVAYAGKVTNRLSVGGFGWRIDRQINRRISGRGQVVLNAYGGIYRLGLAPGEIYYIEPRRVVAWDLSLASITPTLYRKDLTRPTWFTSHYRIINKGLEYLFGVYQFIRRFIGNEKLFRVEGPGDIYLSSRIEPRFPSLRSWIKQNDPYQKSVNNEHATTTVKKTTPHNTAESLPITTTTAKRSQ